MLRSLPGTALLATFVLVSGWSSPVEASDPIGIYAIIDKVVLEPAGDGAPERARIWGVFAVAKGHGRRGQHYQPPVRGFLYFQLDGAEDKAEKSRNEWKDLLRLAGSGECVGFGSRYQKPPPKVRQGDDPGKPDTYETGWGGVRKLPAGTKRVVVRHLRALPTPISPAPGETTRLGLSWRGKDPLVLVARNCAGNTAETHYVFELEAANGEIIGSPPIPAGESKTEWKVPGLLHENMKYTWRVRIVGKGHDGGVPVAVSHFETGSEK